MEPDTITLEQRLRSDQIRRQIQAYLLDQDDNRLGAIADLLGVQAGITSVAAALAFEAFNSEMQDPNPYKAGVAQTVGAMFLNGQLDLSGVKNGQLVWSASHTGLEQEADT